MIAGTRQNDDPHVFILSGCGEGVIELLEQRRRLRVAVIRPIQSDPGNPIRFLVEHVIVSHFSLQTASRDVERTALRTARHRDRTTSTATRLSRQEHWHGKRIAPLIAGSSPFQSRGHGAHTALLESYFADYLAELWGMGSSPPPSHRYGRARDRHDCDPTPFRSPPAQQSDGVNLLRLVTALNCVWLQFQN